MEEQTNEQFPGGGDEAAVEKRVRPPRGARQCRRLVFKRVAESLSEIADTFTEHAVKGSVPHFKELMRLSGLDKEVEKKPVERPPKSFAQLLMEELERQKAAGEL